MGDITISPNPNGSVDVRRPGGAGDEGILIPISVPAVLYGHNVDVEAVVVYYRCDSPSSYIDNTWLNKQTGASTQDVIVTDSTNRTSTSDSSYVVYPSPSELSSGAGSLNLHLDFIFANGTDDIKIGAVRVTLGHPRTDSP
jgi:hypothetical protein